MGILPIFKHALIISFFVFVMMLLVDFIDTASKRKVSHIIKGGKWRQYTLASFLGSTPGCLGAFMNVSLYIHGMISFGAIVGGMIATSGDEAFVMLTQFPVTAMALFVLLFISGVFFAWISDKVIKVLKFVPGESCLEGHCELCISDLSKLENLRDVIRLSNLISNLRSLSFTRFLLLLLIVSFLCFVTLGIVGPSSWDWKRFVQDGHGMLPMLSYSLKDSLFIKALNLVFGIAVGGILYILGL